MTADHNQSNQTFSLSIRAVVDTEGTFTTTTTSSAVSGDVHPFLLIMRVVGLDWTRTPWKNP